MHRDSLLNTVRAALSGHDRRRTAPHSTFHDTVAPPRGTGSAGPTPPATVDIHLVLNALALLRNRCGPSNAAVLSMIDALSGHLGEGFYLQRRRYQASLGHLEQWCQDTLLLTAGSRGQRGALRCAFSGLDGPEVYDLTEAVDVLARLFRLLDAQADQQDTDIRLAKAGDFLLVDVQPLREDALAQLAASSDVMAPVRREQGRCSFRLALRPAIF